MAPFLNISREKNFANLAWLQYRVISWWINFREFREKASFSAFGGNKFSRISRMVRFFKISREENFTNFANYPFFAKINSREDLFPQNFLAARKYETLRYILTQSYIVMKVVIRRGTFLLFPFCLDINIHGFKCVLTCSRLYTAPTNHAILL